MAQSRAGEPRAARGRSGVQAGARGGPQAVGAEAALLLGPGREAEEGSRLRSWVQGRTQRGDGARRGVCSGRRDAEATDTSTSSWGQS